MFKSLLALFLSVSSLSVEEKAAQMLVVGFDGTTPPAHIIRDIETFRIGGVILFEKNVESPAQLRKLTDALHTIDSSLLITIDQEGGRVARLNSRNGFPPTVSAQYLGQKDDTALTRRYAREMALTLKSAGINVDFAPCVDLNINPENPAIGAVERSYSADPAVVVKHASIVLEELRKAGMAGCLKHFPGHGSSTVDTHLAAADVTKTWRKEELEPYAALINKSPMVMTSHIFNAHLDPEFPATMSHKILTDLLRKKMGFEGIIITDDLAMRAMVDNYSLKEIVINAINAGADLLCLSNNIGGYDPDLVPRVVKIIADAVEHGRISEKRLNEAVFKNRKI